MIKWHRLFGLALQDFFTGTSYLVELERDLSIQQQFLDVLIIEKKGGEALKNLPDGLEKLAKHNLLTYKSHQQALDEWALDELLHHYVSYRKIVSSSTENNLPDITNFQLYAVSARYPKNLESDYNIKFVKDGVYDIKWGSCQIRIIVLSRVPKEKRNAIWQLFSAEPNRVQYGRINYKWRKPDTSTIINELFSKYRIEGIAMPYTIEDFKRDYVLEHFEKLPIDDRLKGLSANDRLKGLSANDRLKGLSKDDRLKGLSKDDRLKGLSKDDLLKKLSANDRLKGLSIDDLLSSLGHEQIDALMKKLNK